MAINNTDSWLLWPPRRAGAGFHRDEQRAQHCSSCCSQRAAAAVWTGLRACRPQQSVRSHAPAAVRLAAARLTTDRRRGRRRWWVVSSDDDEDETLYRQLLLLATITMIHTHRPHAADHTRPRPTVANSHKSRPATTCTAGVGWGLGCGYMTNVVCSHEACA